MTAQVLEMPQHDEFPIEPLEDIVIIRPAVEEKRSSGIVLAGGAEKIPAGWVVAAGPGRVYEAPMNAGQTRNSGAVFVPNPVKVGDYVVFGRYTSGGEPIEYAGKVYIMARVGDLAGKSRDGQQLTLRRVRDWDGNSDSV